MSTRILRTSRNETAGACGLGEFGAVSVISGSIRGQTNTMPLQVENFYNEYNSVAAFALASLLAILALVTLVLKSLLQWQAARSLALADREERPNSVTV